jgi:hypothetical protein
MTPTSATLAVSDKAAEPPAPASAILTVGEKSVELPIRKGTVGPSVIDIGKLYAQTGILTYDPGFTSTASTESEISLRPATCSCMASCRPPRRRPTSTIGSPATPWCTSR